MIRLYRENYGAISDYTRRHPNLIIRNYTVPGNGLEVWVRDHDFMPLFTERQDAFSINASIGFILYNRAENRYRYFHSSINNARLFAMPLRVNNIEQFQEFLARFKDADFIETAAMSRENSSWVVHRVCNVTFFINLIVNHPIRAGATELPAWVKDNQYIVAMNKNSQNVLWDDDLCLFRCLAYHRNNRSKTNITRRAIDLKQSYLDSLPPFCQSEREVTIQNLHMLEEFFDVSIHVFELVKDSRVSNDDGVSVLKRRHPPIERPNKMNVHWYKDHFSYITSVEGMCKSYTCDRCYRLWPTLFRMERHKRTCTEKVRVIHPSRLHHKPVNVFEELEQENIIIRKLTLTQSHE